MSRQESFLGVRGRWVSPESLFKGPLNAPLTLRSPLGRVELTPGSDGVVHGTLFKGVLWKVKGTKSPSGLCNLEGRERSFSISAGGESYSVDSIDGSMAHYFFRAAFPRITHVLLTGQDLILGCSMKSDMVDALVLAAAMDQLRLPRAWRVSNTFFPVPQEYRFMGRSWGKD